jgi:hypothetical protein
MGVLCEHEVSYEADEIFWVKAVVRNLKDSYAAENKIIAD